MPHGLATEGPPLAATRLVVAYGALPAHALLRAEVARFHRVSPAQHRPGARVPAVRQRRARAAAPAGRRPRSGARRTSASPAQETCRWSPSPTPARSGSTSRPRARPTSRASTTSPCTRASAPRLRTDPTRAWVRKEALLKAYGLGLAVDPSDVRLDDDGLAAWDSRHRPPGAVWLRDLAVPGHVVAVAVLPLADHDVARSVGHGEAGIDVINGRGASTHGGRSEDRAADAGAARRGRGRRAARRRPRRRATRTSRW